MREWREFSEPITERNKANPMLSRTNFDAIENRSKHKIITSQSRWKIYFLCILSKLLDGCLN